MEAILDRTRDEIDPKSPDDSKIPSFDKLPDDILRNIFSFMCCIPSIMHKNVLGEFQHAGVNTRWRTIAHDVCMEYKAPFNFSCIQFKHSFERLCCVHTPQPCRWLWGYDNYHHSAAKSRLIINNLGVESSGRDRWKSDVTTVEDRIIVPDDEKTVNLLMRTCPAVRKVDEETLVIDKKMMVHMLLPREAADDLQYIEFEWFGKDMHVIELTISDDDFYPDEDDSDEEAGIREAIIRYGSQRQNHILMYEGRIT